jgi:hypothetical protein
MGYRKNPSLAVGNGANDRIRKARHDVTALTMTPPTSETGMLK